MRPLPVTRAVAPNDTTNTQMTTDDATSSIRPAPAIIWSAGPEFWLSVSFKSRHSTVNGNPGEDETPFVIGISLEEGVRAVANVPFESRGYSSICLSQGETAHVSAFVDGVVRFLQVPHLS